MSTTRLQSITQGRVRRRVRLPGFTLTETFHEADTSLTEHVHCQAALSLVLGGNFEETVAGDRFHCGPLSLLYKPPEAPHLNSYGPAGARTLLVAPDRDTLRRLEQLLPRREDRAIRFEGPIASRALALYADPRGWSSHATVDWEELLAEALDRRLDTESGGTPAWLERVDASIRERFAERLQLSQLAEEVGVHPVHLARTYRRRYRCSIGDALRRRRIDHAVSRLQDGTVDLAALALECGFADQSHFTRAFGREIGESPGRFRTRALSLLGEDGPGTG